MIKLYADKAWLYDRIVRKGWKPQDVAEFCQCTVQTVYRYMGKYGIK